MDGEGVHRRILLEEEPGAVAVVNIEIHDQDRFPEAARAEPRHGDGHVVQGAEAHPAVRRRMVESPAEVHRNQAGPKRDGGGQDRPAGGEALCLDDSLRLDVGEGRAHHLFHHLPALERLEVAVGVHSADVLHGGGLRANQFPATHQSFVGQESEHHLPAQGIHRNRVEADHIPGIVDQYQA